MFIGRQKPESSCSRPFNLLTGHESAKHQPHRSLTELMVAPTNMENRTNYLGAVRTEEAMLLRWVPHPDQYLSIL